MGDATRGDAAPVDARWLPHQARHMVTLTDPVPLCCTPGTAVINGGSLRRRALTFVMFGLATLTVAGLVSAGTAMARTDLPAGGKQASASLGTTDLSEAYAGDAAASDDRFQTTRTDWWVSSKVDAATLAQRVADNNARLTSLT